MNITKKIVLGICLFSLSQIVCQEKKTDDKQIKEVSEVDKTAEEVKETTQNTNDAINSTVKNSKEALKTIGSIFGSGKKNKTKTKGAVVVDIQQITYDDQRLNKLYGYLTDAKGVKKTSRSFNGGNASITITFKESADQLWQGVPTKIQGMFKMVEMSEKRMLLQVAQNKVDGK